MAKIVAHLKRVAPSVPVILFTKNGGQHLEVMAETGCAALGLDWTTDLASARARVGDRVALQGNLDPAILFASPAKIERSEEHTSELQSLMRISYAVFCLKKKKKKK